MSANVVAILVAVIAGSGIPLWFLERFDKRNTDQHNANLSVLQDIKKDIKDVKEDTRQVRFQLGRHLEWHVSGDEDNDIKGTTAQDSDGRKMPSRKTIF